MSWTTHSVGLIGVYSSPIYCSDGNMWAIQANGLTVNTILIEIVAPTGVLVATLSFSGFGRVNGEISQPITDGTNFYFTYHDPSGGGNWLVSIGVVSHVLTRTALGLEPLSGYGATPPYAGLVSLGGSAAMASGGTGAPTAKVQKLTLPSTAGTVSASFGSTFAGQCFFDGTSLWMPNYNGSTAVYKVNPSTLAASTVTLAHVPASTGTFGFDGRYIYMPAASGGGIIVFDTTTSTSAVFGAGTTYQACYYSVNFTELFIWQGNSNAIYAMPAGGGTIVSVGPTGGSSIIGVGDGAPGMLWAAGYNNPTVGTFSLYTLPTLPGKIVMLM